MNTRTALTKAIALTTLALWATFTASANNTLDDFSDPKQNSLGIDRAFADDSAVGGKTSTNYTVAEGVLHAQGEIAPPRGQPGWASAIFLLQSEGLPQDLSQYQGIQLRIRIQKGNISISANSSEVTNFDYHAAPVTRYADGEFHEVKIPFSSMKRAWSEQTALNTKTISSLSLVAFDLQAGSFDYEVDEISFY